MIFSRILALTLVSLLKSSHIETFKVVSRKAVKIRLFLCPLMSFVQSFSESENQLGSKEC